MTGTRHRSGSISLFRMNIPPESPSFSEEEMEAAAATLKWQAASARAAGAKHRARLIDQLDAQTEEVGRSDADASEFRRGA